MTMMTTEEIAAPNKIDKTTTDIVFISIPEIQILLKLTYSPFSASNNSFWASNRAFSTDGQLFKKFVE